MTGRAPDQRACPFCAAEILAAAVKCPSCRADLPDPAPGTASARIFTSGEPQPDPGLRQDSPEPSAGLPSARSGSPARVLVGLVVAALVLAAGSVWLLVSDGDDGAARPAAYTSAGPGPVVVPGSTGAGVPADDPAVAQARAAASRHAVAVLSYDYRTLARDQRSAHAVMSSDFRVEYDKVMRQTVPRATRGKLALKATVVASSLVALDPDRAMALLFVNAVTTAKDSPERQLNQNRVLMTMTRQDGAWIVSQIEAF
ncbi:MAG: hypothetical protein NTV23_05655 [Propionibacteriales bacterium]|nr:hypothetical protein [Propionibacteriales bacterium]